MISTDEMVIAVIDALNKQDASLTVFMGDGGSFGANLDQFARDLIAELQAANFVIV